MPKIADFIKSMAEKAGIPADNPELIKLLDNDSIKEAEVDASVSNLIDRNLINFKAAATHPDVRKELKPMFFAEAYNGLDAELSTLMDELGLNDDVRKALNEEKSSTKRAALLARKVKEIESETAKKSGNSDKTELLSKVNELNQKISQLQAEHSSAITKMQEETNTLLLNKEIEFDLAGFRYALPEKMSQATKISTAKMLVEAEMRAKGISVRNENGQKKLVRADGTDYTDETHRAINYNDFLTGVLANNDLLMASGNDGNAGNKQYPDRVDRNDGGTNKQVNHKYASAVDADLDNYLNAPAEV